MEGLYPYVSKEGKLPGPSSYDESTCDEVVVRINPINAYTGLGVYSSYGALSIHPHVILDKSNLYVLSHEVGHGIFGIGHHEPRGCVMDGGNENISFCHEYKNTLHRLIHISNISQIHEEFQTD